MIPINRITHGEHCPTHWGGRCACDREQLAAGHADTQRTVIATAILVLALAFAAQVFGP